MFWERTNVAQQFKKKVIFSGYVTFYQINIFFLNILFFYYWQIVFFGRVKWLGGFDPQAGVWRTLM